MYVKKNLNLFKKQKYKSKDIVYCFIVWWKRNVGWKEVTKNTPCKQSAVSNTLAEDHYVKAWVSCMN